MQKPVRRTAVVAVLLAVAAGVLFVARGSASAALFPAAGRAPEGHCGSHAYDRFDRFYPWVRNRLTEFRRVG
ncbi:hypothetical protein SAMN05216533_0632 [Streptomyces sp. Ag109_O5-10]|nr:hypothetical protein SAMN05216533_0632 [Streptomyces sp. Ag109_O5-10]